MPPDASDTSALPRLLYVSDVPVESTYHGSALIYRLLSGYPSDRLLVVEGGATISLPHRRLPAVRYASLPMGWRRLVNTRLAQFQSTLLSILAPCRLGELLRLIKPLKPDAVLTVAHGASWMLAHALAQRLQVPLHVICHDEIKTAIFSMGFGRNLMLRRFARVYRCAAVRYCVSPYMRDDYRKRFGADAVVLYPSRAADARLFADPPGRVRELQNQPLRVAFAGTINGEGYAQTLRWAAEALKPIGGRLLIFGPLSLGAAKTMGLNFENVELRGLLPPEELLLRLRQETDVLLAPQSFSPEDRQAVRISFLSKFADYTLAGLPMVVFGPPEGSACSWVRENPNVAITVAQPSVSALRAEFEKLRSSPDLRWQLAKAALETGAKFFDGHRIRQVFWRHLMESGRHLQN